MPPPSLDRRNVSKRLIIGALAALTGVKLREFREPVFLTGTIGEEIDPDEIRPWTDRDHPGAAQPG